MPDFLTQDRDRSALKQTSAFLPTLTSPIQWSISLVYLMIDGLFLLCLINQVKFLLFHTHIMPGLLIWKRMISKCMLSKLKFMLLIGYETTLGLFKDYNTFDSFYLVPVLRWGASHPSSLYGLLQNPDCRIEQTGLFEAGPGTDSHQDWRQQDQETVWLPCSPWSSH